MENSSLGREEAGRSVWAGVPRALVSTLLHPSRPQEACAAEETVNTGVRAERTQWPVCSLAGGLWG